MHSLTHTALLLQMHAEERQDSLAPGREREVQVGPGHQADGEVGKVRAQPLQQRLGHLPAHHYLCVQKTQTGEQRASVKCREQRA